MVYNPNANWTSEVAEWQQTPIYFLRIDGLSEDYSTGPVKSAGTTKTIIMNTPKFSGQTVDIIKGTRTAATVKVELVDIGEEITDLVATEASGAPLPSLVNRKATIYGGYADLAESDYPAVFVGHISDIRLLSDLTTYEMTLADNTYLLDGEIMSNATDSTPVTIRGNPVNVYWSILTGTFSTTHGTFPLDSVSTATTVSSAPTGLGIAEASINTTQLISQRDDWRGDDIVNFEIREPQDARQYLEDQLFRALQCFPAISGDGLLGLRFHVPPSPPSSAPTITTDDIVSVGGWRRLYKDHLNKFVIKGDYDHDADTYADLYNTETAEDTADQTTTGETIKYDLESQWLDSTYGGDSIASELAGRLRVRYLKTPAMLEVDVTMRKRAIEEGDAVALTHPEIPNLQTGTRGVTAQLFTVTSIKPNFEAGTIRLSLLDTRLKKFGVIAPSGTANYGSATDQEKNTFCWAGATSTNLVGGSDEGYRSI